MSTNSRPENKPKPEQSDAEAIRLTSWSLLLSHWTSMARVSVALPETSAGKAWKASVAPCIGLQAHVFALAELDRLEADERCVGLDRAAVGIDHHERSLREAWSPEAMPEGVAELIEDARGALGAARAQSDG